MPEDDEAPRPAGTARRQATPRLRSLLAAGLALTLPAAAPAAATEYTLFRPVMVPTENPAALRSVPSILNVPSGWQPGHAAAVLLFDPPDALPLRDAILSALLDSGAAVLELDANAARGFSSDSAANPPPPTAESLLHDLAGALVALRRDAGAGVVVAVGHGMGGEAALLAAEPARLAELLGEDGPSYAALVSVGPGAPAFRAGTPPGRAEAWAMRAPMLCGVLAFAFGALPTPRPPAADPDPAATDRACRLALAGAAR